MMQVTFAKRVATLMLRVGLFVCAVLLLQFSPASLKDAHAQTTTCTNALGAITDQTIRFYASTNTCSIVNGLVSNSLKGNLSVRLGARTGGLADSFRGLGGAGLRTRSGHIKCDLGQGDHGTGFCRDNPIPDGTFNILIEWDVAGTTHRLEATFIHDDTANTIQVTSATVTVISKAETAPQVSASFMANRANQILNNQPNLISFIDGTNTGGAPLGDLTVDGNDNALALGFATSRSRIKAAQQRAAKQALAYGVKKANDNATLHALAGSPLGRKGTWDVWTKVGGTSSRHGTAKNSFWIGHAGAHYFVSQHLLMGVLGQIDWTKEDRAVASSSASGTGWMVGPYLVGQIPNQNLFYEARASWGQSRNSVSPIGTYSDSFATTRWLVSGKVSGTLQHGKITIKPKLSLSYFEETQNAYTDSLANAIPGQTLSLGQLSFGPTFSRTIELASGTIVQPSFGVSGVWNFGIRSNAASQATVLGNNDLRARLDAGVAITGTGGISLLLATHYDGLGITSYDAWGGTAKLAIPLN